MKDLTSKVVQWGKDKGIFEKSNPEKQNDGMSYIFESIGIIQMSTQSLLSSESLIETKITIALHHIYKICCSLSISPEYCLEQAYNVISKRTGKMVNGLFVKDS